MSLVDRLDQDMKQAMRDKDKARLSVIRMVRSALKNKEIDQRRPLSEDEVLDVLNREVKQRRDSLQEFEKANRPDLVEGVKQELNILAEYLPEPLSEGELETLIRDTIKETGAVSKADMGKVMGALMPKVKGKADGKIVNQMVQRLLGG
jgi:hypothetical protein